MFPRVKQVRHLGEYRLELSFTDDTKGELDFKERVVGRGGVFAPLQDIDFFKQVRVDPEVGTIVWPNEVDFCPDVLYSLVTGKPIRVERRAHVHEPLTPARQPRRAGDRQPTRVPTGKVKASRTRRVGGR
jgi:hypothetical protein